MFTGFTSDKEAFTKDDFNIVINVNDIKEKRNVTLGKGAIQNINY
jgi:hypothetical protein